MSGRVFFYVQHLLGIGHLVRAVRIARALAAAGFAVDLVLGGTPVPGLDLGPVRVTQLTPVRTTPAFGALLHDDGSPFGTDAKAARRDHLLATFAASRADVLLVEAFPFGRRQMDFELLPLLESARAASRRPLVAVSVRDILQRARKPQRAAEAVAIIDSCVDLVLVHGDPQLGRLAETFPLAERFAVRTVYTGIVTAAPDGLPPIADHAVVVSAGGGAVGDRLVRAALAARTVSPLSDSRWLVVTGPNLPDGADAGIRALITPGVDLVRFAPDLPRRLRGAALSISQAGYNTVADLLVCGCRAVLVPFTAGGETEQADRARLLDHRGLAVMLDEASLSVDSVAAAMRRALALPSRPLSIDLDGAARTAAILRERLVSRRA